MGGLWRQSTLVMYDSTDRAGLRDPLVGALCLPDCIQLFDYTFSLVRILLCPAHAAALLHFELLVCDEDTAKRVVIHIRRLGVLYSTILAASFHDQFIIHIALSAPVAPCQRCAGTVGPLHTAHCDRRCQQAKYTAGAHYTRLLVSSHCPLPSPTRVQCSLGSSMCVPPVLPTCIWPISACGTAGGGQHRQSAHDGEERDHYADVFLPPFSAPPRAACPYSASLADVPLHACTCVPACLPCHVCPCAADGYWLHCFLKHSCPGPIIHCDILAISASCP